MSCLGSGRDGMTNWGLGWQALEAKPGCGKDARPESGRELRSRHRLPKSPSRTGFASLRGVGCAVSSVGSHVRETGSSVATIVHFQSGFHVGPISWGLQLQFPWGAGTTTAWQGPAVSETGGSGCRTLSPCKWALPQKVGNGLPVKGGALGAG